MTKWHDDGDGDDDGAGGGGGGGGGGDDDDCELYGSTYTWSLNWRNI